MRSILFLNLIQVTESISGSVVPLAMFRDSSEIFEFIPCVFLLFEPGHHAGKSGVGEGEVVLKARRGEECGNGGFMQRLSTKLKYYSWHPPRVSESDWAEKKYSWE